jgi:hypothetical protein
MPSQHCPPPIDTRVQSDLAAGRLDSAIQRALDDEMANRFDCHDGDALRLLEFLLNHRKEFRMSQVQLTIGFTVAAANPLTVTPSSVSESLTVGVPVPTGTIAVVTGGVPSYTYPLDATSAPLPPGVTLAEDGNGNISLTGTPTTAQPLANVIVDVTDSLGAQAQLKLK